MVTERTSRSVIIDALDYKKPVVLDFFLRVERGELYFAEALRQLGGYIAQWAVETGIFGIISKDELYNHPEFQRALNHTDVATAYNAVWNEAKAMVNPPDPDPPEPDPPIITDPQPPQTDPPPNIPEEPTKGRTPDEIKDGIVAVKMDIWVNLAIEAIVNGTGDEADWIEFKHAVRMDFTGQGLGHYENWITQYQAIATSKAIAILEDTKAPPPPDPDPPPNADPGEPNDPPHEYNNPAWYIGLEGIFTAEEVYQAENGNAGFQLHIVTTLIQLAEANANPEEKEELIRLAEDLGSAWGVVYTPDPTETLADWTGIKKLTLGGVLLFALGFVTLK